MTEKIDSMEIHPMRGHSRGEWYCSVDDIAPREDEAEYWAVFGVTHRGNKHCLGEFPTKSATETAAQGLESLGRPARRKPSRRGRRFHQTEGEWNYSLDDIAPGEDEAEYWALVGSTERGHEQCAGASPTKSGADLAAKGQESPGRPATRMPTRRGRRFIQIEIVVNENDVSMVDIFALCEDGSIWRRGIGTGRHSGLIDHRWERISLDGLDELEPEEKLGAAAAASH